MIRLITALQPSRTASAAYIRILLWIVIISIVELNFSFISDSVFLPTVIHLSIVYLLLGIVSDTIVLAINFFYRKRHKRSERYVDSFTIGITRLSDAITLFIFLLFIVDVFIPIKTLLGSITISIAVVGLAFRDFVTNFMNGLNIMFSGRFQLGEYIRIGQTKGKIKDLTFTHVQLQTETQDIVFVPNNLVLSQEVVNFSKNKEKNIFVPLVIDRVYYRHYAELKEYIATHASAQFKDTVVSGVKIRVESLEKESVNWLIEYTVSHYDFELETQLKNFTAEMVVDFFAAKGDQISGEMRTQN